MFIGIFLFLLLAFILLCPLLYTTKEDRELSDHEQMLFLEEYKKKKEQKKKKH